MVQVPPPEYRYSAPTSITPWGAPGSSGRLAHSHDALTRGAACGHWAPSHCPRPSSEPPPLSTLPLSFHGRLVTQARAPGRLCRGGRRHARAADPRDTARPNVGAWPRAAAGGGARAAPRTSCQGSMCPKVPCAQPTRPPTAPGALCMVPERSTLAVWMPRRGCDCALLPAYRSLPNQPSIGSAVFGHPGQVRR